MNSETKSAIKSLVLDLRHTLEDELAIALRRYGVFTDRNWSLEAPPDRLTEPRDREIWRRVVTVVKQRMQEGRTLQDASVLATASLDYVRESAFTFLNRLVGLKCLEVRGIIDEVITTRDIYGGRSKAHRDYREEHPREARAADDALPACLESVWRHVNDEMIGYLFDPDDDHSLVWPRYAVLKDCIAKINRLDEEAWAEDEIIGWIYQFYNAREKEAIRSRGKPQTPHDVAVINQFFTPRWIVKFLVDNTLGRLWLEMHPGSERVREKCDYLVPEPLAEAEVQGDGGTGRHGEGEAEKVGDGKGDFQLDPDSPINNPEAEPQRVEKAVPRIRLLDPACGTMHFGHYAMEVFEAMYRDARDWGHLQIEDWEIPAVILENNLFGVDIDRRAVQLAALSLFMKARTMHPEARVRQVNLVAADATLPDSDVRETFLERYAKTPRVQEAFAQVLDDMDQVAELGSLLRVEGRLRELLSDAGRAAGKEAIKALDPRGQRDLPGMEPPVRQMGLADLADDEEQAAAWTPQYTLRELREDLRAFARRALDEHDLNAQLFATEADKAVRLLDVLMADYEVVVMNPPFGDTMSDAQKHLKKLYPHSYKNLLCTFLDRGKSLTHEKAGFVGAIVDKSSTLRSTYEGFRDHVIVREGALVSMVDLGWGVLDDANVETVTVVLESASRTAERSTAFLRVADQNPSYKRSRIELLLDCMNAEQQSDDFFVIDLNEFSTFPNKALSYWVPASVRRLFRDHPPMDPRIAKATEGIKPADAARFIKYWWEVRHGDIGGPDAKWALVSNGGYYSPFYRTITEIILYENDGQEIKNHRNAKGQKSSRTTAEEFYFRSGITYGKRTNFLSVQRLERNQLFTNEGHAVFPHDPEDTWHLIALLNSQLLQFTINTICGQHKAVGYVRLLPYVEPTGATRQGLKHCSRWGYDIKRAWDTGNEICTRFNRPWLVQLTRLEDDDFVTGLGRVLELLGDYGLECDPSESVTLKSLLDTVRAIERAADAGLQRLQVEIDEAVYDLYEISAEDRRLIQRELGERPPEVVWPEMDGKSDRKKREEHVKRFFSYFALQAVREDEDGIVPLAGCGGREPYLMDRVRAKLEETFGAATAYELEKEAADYINRDLETQLHTYFFHHFHVDLYKKRPILWHLTSDKKTFAVMLDYHRLDGDTLPKVRSQYLWPQMESVRTRLAAARVEESVATIAELEEELEDLKAFEERLESVIQGTVKVKLPKWANGPYRNGEPPYDPDLNDGVKVNLLPIQKARLLPVKRVV